MPRDMICVYHAADMGQADIIVAWLRERGIEACVKDAFAAATLPTSLIIAPRGIEVCVMDPDQAERAALMLRGHFAATERERGPEQTEQTIEATCEECGESAEFPFAERGTVQTCPHCREYIDVPSG